MTDREKPIELIIDIENELIRAYPYTTDIFRIEETADYLIANGVTIGKDNNVPGKWIPVTERLPEKSGTYIVCCDDSGCPYGEGIWYRPGVVVCAEADVGTNGGICWEWYEGSTIYDLDGIVTHWMPLPEAPKEGEDNA